MDKPATAKTIADNFRRRNPDLTKEDVQRMTKKAISDISLAFLLVDVANSFLLDADSFFAKINIKTNDSDSRNMRNLADAVRRARIMSGIAAKSLYKMADEEDAVYDSEWWYNTVRLVESRINDDPVKSNQFIEYLLNMPQRSDYYSVKYEDYKRTTYKNKE